MCHRDAASWSAEHLSCVSDIVAHTQVGSSPKDPQCKFSASATNAIDIYKRLCIIYFCDERETTQVASITFARDGIRLVNLGASMGDASLPASVFLARTMFVLYDVYPPEGAHEIQVMVNFSTMMDYLECALANVAQDDLVHPMHFVLDNWLYLSLQRSPTIGDLDKAISTSLTAAIDRFCLIPTDCFGGVMGESSQVVPRSGDQMMREYDELMDNTILMLHPLSAKQVDPALLYPFQTPTHTISKLPPKPAKSPSTSSSSSSSSSSSKRASSSPLEADGASVGDDELPPPPPRKRLKTTLEQVNLLEEWFQKEPLPPRKLREEMLKELDNSISLRQLEVWFQNRRAKQKKAEARAMASSRHDRDESPQVPFDTPPSSPSTPPSLSPPAYPLASMAPNPAALIPPTSPLLTPPRSHKKSKSKAQSPASPPAARAPATPPSQKSSPAASPVPSLKNSPTTPKPRHAIPPQLATQFTSPAPTAKTIARPGESSQ